MQTLQKYHKETKTVSFNGKTVVVENLTPVLPPKAREQRKKEIEQGLFDVFVKYQGKRCK